MNVFLNARGNKSMNGLVLVSTAANVGGGNVAGNIFQQVDVGAAKLGNELRRRRVGIAFGVCGGHQIRRNHQLQSFRANAWAVSDDEIAKTQQRFVFLPHRNIEKRVGSNDEENAVTVSMIGVAKIADGVDGIVQLVTGKV